MFSIVEQLEAYHDKAIPPPEPCGGRIHKLDATRAQNTCPLKQVEYSRQVESIDKKAADTYAKAQAYVAALPKDFRFSFTEVAAEFKLSFPAAKALTVKLLMGRHIFKDGTMGNNGEKTAYRRR